MYSKSTKARMLAMMAATSFSLQGWGASLHVSPVSLRMAPGQGAVGITLSNPSDQPLVAQVRLFAWGQKLDEDQLVPQQDLMVSPPITTIPARSEQTVRIVRPNGGNTARELSYRLLIDELPAQSSATGDAAAVDIRIRYSVPLFVASSAPASDPIVSWTLVHQGADWFIRAANRGSTHAQLSAVTIRDPGYHDIEVADGLLGYALAGSTRQWRVPEAPAGGQALQIAATVNGHSVTAPLDSSDTDAAH